MDFDLSGKTALVTGGNIGIGQAVALILGQAGADVAITYLSHSGNETVEELKQMGRTAEMYRLDVTDSVAVRQTIPRIAEGLGGHIDILVNNAGGLVARRPFAEMDETFWRRVLDLNLTSAFTVTRAVLPFMNRGWGRIIMVSSLAGENGGGPGAIAYATAKAGMIGFTRGLAKELGPHGITVNAIAPGLILDTPFHPTHTSPESQQATIRSTPVQRAGYPNDCAAAVLYLASDAAGFVTGDTININGGTWFL